MYVYIVQQIYLRVCVCASVRARACVPCLRPFQYGGADSDCGLRIGARVCSRVSEQKVRDWQVSTIVAWPGGVSEGPHQSRRLAIDTGLEDIGRQDGSVLSLQGFNHTSPADNDNHPH